MEYTRDLKRAYQTSLVLYAAFMMSLVIYFVVFEVFEANIPDFRGLMESPELPWLRYAFFILGAMQAIFIKVLREKLMNGDTTGEVKTLISLLQKVSMISASLCEVPVIFGLVLFFLSGNRGDFYILLIMSFVLFMVYFPKYTNWDLWMQSKVSRR